MRPDSLGPRPRRRLALLLPVLWGIGVTTPVTAPAADDLTKLRDKARTLHEAGRDGEALPVHDAIIALAPEDGAAHQERALARWWALHAPASEGDFAAFEARMCLESREPCAEMDRVLADFGRAIALLPAPRRAGAFHDRAGILLERGEAARALTDLDEALRLLPEAAALRSRRAEARHQLGDRAGALADLDAAIGAGDDPSDRVRRAEIRREVGDLGGAQADLDAALNRPPDAHAGDWQTRAHRLRREIAKSEGVTSVVLSVADAQPGLDDDGRAFINVSLEADSAKRFAEFTSLHVGGRAQVLVGGSIAMEPVIRTPITGGRIQISVGSGFTLQAIVDMATRLRRQGTIEVRIPD